MSSQEPLPNRPDYVPPSWRNTASARWLAASPGRMLTYWVFAIALSAALVAWAITDPHSYFHGGLPYAGLFGAGTTFLLSFIYVPRMLRAMRHR